MARYLARFVPTALKYGPSIYELGSKIADDVSERQSMRSKRMKN